MSGPRAFERVQQRGFADEYEVIAEVFAVEQLVLEVDDLLSAPEDVPPADDVHRLLRRRLVEGDRCGSPPVRDERFVLLVVHGYPSDVDGRLIGQIDPSEDE